MLRFIYYKTIYTAVVCVCARRGRRAAAAARRIDYVTCTAFCCTRATLWRRISGSSAWISRQHFVQYAVSAQSMHHTVAAARQPWHCTALLLAPPPALLPSTLTPPPVPRHLVLPPSPWTSHLSPGSATGAAGNCLPIRLALHFTVRCFRSSVGDHDCACVVRQHSAQNGASAQSEHHTMASARQRWHQFVASSARTAAAIRA